MRSGGICFSGQVVYLLLILLCLGPITVPALTNSDQADKPSADVRSSPLQQIEDLLRLCRETWRENPRESVGYARRAEVLAGEQNFPRLTADAWYHAAMAYFYLGEYKNSLTKLQDALRIGESALGPALLVKIYNGLGMVHKNLGDFDAGLEYYLQALTLLEKDGDKKRLGIINNNISGIYLNLEKFDQSLRYLQEARKFWEEVGYSVGLAVVENNLGDNYSARGDYQKAAIHYRRSLEMRNEQKNRWGVASSLNNLGDTYFARGDYRTAGDYYRRSLKIQEELQNREGIALSLYSLARVNFEQGRYSRVGDLLNRSLRIAEEEQILNLQQKIYLALSELHDKEGRYRLALDFYRQYSDTRDTMFNASMSNRVAEMQMLYEVEKRDKKITMLEKESRIQELALSRQRNFRNFLIIITALVLLLVMVLYNRFRVKKKANKELFRVNRELTRSEKKLHELNQTKDKFFSIIAHDLRNTLSGFKGFSEILVQHFADLSQTEKLDRIRMMLKAAEDLNKLLENLLYWSRAQTGAIKFTPRDCDLKEIIGEIMELMKPVALRKEITLTHAVMPASRVRCDRDMITTVIRNLISNAIKFTPAGGKVEVFLRRLEDRFEVGVADTGVGMTDEDLAKLFRIDIYHSTPGTREETGTGLGLILCREFVQKHGGEIRVTSEINKGSTFYFTIPRAG